MDTLRVAEWGGKHLVYLPFYVAQHTGQFASLGLEIERYGAGNDNEIYQEVVSGRADLGVGDPAFVALGAQEGHESCVVAALVNNVSSWGLTPHAEIRAMKESYDLVGLRFGTYPRPSTSYSLLGALKARHARALKSMQIVEAPIGAQLSLLASGKADVVVEIEPMVSIAESQGLRVVLSMGDFYRDFLFTGVMATRATVESRGPLVQRFVVGLQRGLTLCHRDRPVALEVAQNLFPSVARECLERALARMLDSHAWPEQVFVQASAWNAALQMRRDLGELKSPLDPQHLLEQRFAYAALSQA